MNPLNLAHKHRNSLRWFIYRFLYMFFSPWILASAWQHRWNVSFNMFSSSSSFFLLLLAPKPVTRPINMNKAKKPTQEPLHRTRCNVMKCVLVQIKWDIKMFMIMIFVSELFSFVCVCVSPLLTISTGDLSINDSLFGIFEAKRKR